MATITTSCINTIEGAIEFLILDDVQRDFNSTQVFCNQQGGVMARISNKEEFDFLDSKFEDVQEERGYWIGLQKGNLPSDNPVFFEYVDEPGASKDFFLTPRILPWGPSEPNSEPFESLDTDDRQFANCVIWSKNTQLSFWDDTLCNSIESEGVPLFGLCRKPCSDDDFPREETPSEGPPKTETQTDDEDKGISLGLLLFMFIFAAFLIIGGILMIERHQKLQKHLSVLEGDAKQLDFETKQGRNSE